MAWENRKWIIINYSDVTDDMIDNVYEKRSSLRHTIAGTDKVILKWDGDTPSVFNGMTTYNHSQILAILNDTDGDWTEID